MVGTPSDRISPNYIRERKGLQGLEKIIFTIETQQNVPSELLRGRIFGLWILEFSSVSWPLDGEGKGGIIFSFLPYRPFCFQPPGAV